MFRNDSILTFILTFLITGCLLIGLIFFIPNYKNDGSKIFYIKKGQLAGYIFDDLYEDNLVLSRPATALYSQITGTTASLRAGYYQLPKHASIYKVVKYLSQGIHPVGELIIIDGMTEKDVNNAIKMSPFLGKTYLSSDDIGMLYPDTYQYTYGDDSSIVIKKAMLKMTQTVDELWSKRKKSLPIRSKKQFLIVASILEKEVKDLEDMKVAASIIYNRLKKRIHLGIDATLIYSLDRKINSDDYKFSNDPYNTYRYYGLPPTPISFPGINALNAAAFPDKTDYLYYIAIDDIFVPAKTYKQHKENINKHL